MSTGVIILILAGVPLASLGLLILLCRSLIWKTKKCDRKSIDHDPRVRLHLKRFVDGKYPGRLIFLNEKGEPLTWGAAYDYIYLLDGLYRMKKNLSLAYGKQLLPDMSGKGDDFSEWHPVGVNADPAEVGISIPRNLMDNIFDRVPERFLMRVTWQ